MKRFINYTEYSNILEKLCVKLLTIRHQFSHVYGLPRGGLPIAVHMAHQCNAKFISNLRIFNELITNEYYNFRPHLLICDDVCDSGLSIRQLYETYEHFLLNGLNKMDITVLTLFSKPRMMYKITEDIFKNIQFVCFDEVPDDTWLVFPWETLDSGSDKDYMKG